MTVENGHFEIIGDLESGSRNKRAAAMQFRVVEPVPSAPDYDVSSEFDPPRKWSARATILFVAACSAALWALIIWGAIRFFN